MTENINRLPYNRNEKRWSCLEKAVTKRVKSKFFIRTTDILCAGIALLAGGISSPYTPAFVFLFTAYSYMRSDREAYISVFFIMLCALSKGVVYAYFYALGFAFFFVLNHIVKILNRNLYQWLPLLTGIVVIPFSINANGLHEIAILQPLLTYVLLSEMIKETTWMTKKYTMSQAMFSMLLFVCGVWLTQVFPVFEKEILLLSILIIAITCNVRVCAMIILSMVLLLSFTDTLWLILPLGISIFAQDKKTMMLLLVASLFFLPTMFFDYVYIGLCMVMVLFVQRNRLSFLSSSATSSKEVVHLSKDHVLQRQMQNYAGIFKSLSDYYATMNDTEAEILSNMASALQYQAEEIQKLDDMGKDYDRLKKALEGYQFEVEDIKIDEFKEGCIQVQLEITNIRRGEIKTTLQPLLEALLHRTFELVEMKSRRFERGFIMTFCDHIPYEIEAYGDSLKNSYTSSGDTWSIFRFRQSMICMISDGMGNGERAAQSSKLISSVFQKLMISGIPQDNAIRCINKLIQSDTFATLDVICFNRSKGVAYISKSAACPTYLLRDHKIYEINGTALPVGIVSQMQPDCFEIELKENDEYIMISDGITQRELYDWIHTRGNASMRESVEEFMDILKQKRRKDDSTFITIKVKEQLHKSS